MKTKILATVSALALLAATPAFAETKVETKTGVKADVENAWQDIKQDTSKAYENAKAGTKEAYEDIKAVFIDDEAGNDSSTVTINSRNTATAMLGKAVYNGKDERIGTIKDIIVDANGKAHLVVIGDGEFPGISGKLVAFDYSVIANRNPDGNVIAPLTEETIDQAAAFSYEAKDANDKTRVIPSNGFSVARLIDGDLVNEKKESVAAIDNISFKNGAASQIIIGFDKVLGMGGKHAALDFNAARLVRDGNDLDFQLSANQAAAFESYKKNATN